MRTATGLIVTGLMLLAMALATGCVKTSELGPDDPRAINTAESGGLEVSIELPKRSFAVGESFAVAVTARNVGGGDLAIDAPSGTPVFVRIFRHVDIGWVEALRYPRSSVMVKSPWTLSPGQARTFTLNLTVEPDWPTGKMLRITGELNGRATPAPGVVIHVESRTEQ